MPKLRHSAEVKARAIIRNLQDHVEVSVICAALHSPHRFLSMAETVP